MSDTTLQEILRHTNSAMLNGEKRQGPEAIHCLVLAINTLAVKLLKPIEPVAPVAKPESRCVRSVFNNHYYEVITEGSILTSDGASNQVTVLQGKFPNGLTEIVVVDNHRFAEDYVHV